jgi:hypothetical protein
MDKGRVIDMRKLTVQYGSHGIGMLGRHVTSRHGLGGDGTAGRGTGWDSSESIDL